MSLQFRVNILAVFINGMSLYADAQRAGLGEVAVLAFRLPGALAPECV